MERLWCYLAGFVVALVLVAVFLAVKSFVDDKKTLLEQRMQLVVKEECRTAGRKGGGA